jgi:hypothetical protein
MMFVPPNGKVEGGKKNVDYYDKLKLVIERVKERRNEEEAKLADLFREKTQTDDQEIESILPTVRPRRGPGRPPKLGTSRPSSQKIDRVVDMSWKEGGSTYPKRSSRVGDEYQVSTLPRPGSFTSKDDESTNPGYVTYVWLVSRLILGLFDFENETCMR